MATGPQADFSEDAILAACERIVNSRGFRQSDRMSRFLRFAVKGALANDPARLKEYAVAVEVFDRDPSFDPKTDNIVRVEARRLRKKLKEYYDDEGRQDPIRIELPGPGYLPVFSPGAEEVKAAERPSRWRGWMLLAGAVLMLAGFAGAVILRTAKQRAPRFSSIAVLPLLDLSPGKDQEYFCDGMMDELTESLTTVPGLRVVARTSALAFRSKPYDIRRIGKELNAETVLEGSIRKEGSRIRITVQLVGTADGYHLWSNTYERDVKDVFAVEDEIGRLVTEKVRGSLAPAPPGLAAKRGNTSPAAYDLYLLGRHEWAAFRPDAFMKAVQYYQRSVAIDPQFALGYSGIAEAYCYISEYRIRPPKEVMPLAKEAALKALALDDSLAEAHAALGTVATLYDWDWKVAENEFRRALQLKPGYAYAVHWYGHLLETTGRLPEALSKMQQAQAMDPLSSLINGDLGRTYTLSRQWDQAEAQYRRCLELDPGNPTYQLGLAAVSFERGEYKEASRRLQLLLNVPWMRGMALAALAATTMAANDAGEAQRWRAQFEDLAKSGYVVPDAYIWLDIGLHQYDSAFRRLDKALTDRSPIVLDLLVEPTFDPLRPDPRFSSLLRRMGLEDRSVIRR